MDLSLIERLQVPGLILAGMVIWLLFKLLGRMMDFTCQLLKQLSAQGSTITEMSSLLKQLCGRSSKAGGRE